MILMCMRACATVNNPGLYPFENDNGEISRENIAPEGFFDFRFLRRFRTEHVRDLICVPIEIVDDLTTKVLHTHTHTHTQMCTTPLLKYKRVMGKKWRVPKQTNTHTHTRAHACPHMHMRTHEDTHMYTHTHTHTSHNSLVEKKMIIWFWGFEEKKMIIFSAHFRK